MAKNRNKVKVLAEAPAEVLAEAPAPAVDLAARLAALQSELATLQAIAGAAPAAAPAAASVGKKSAVTRWLAGAVAGTVTPAMAKAGYFAPTDRVYLLVDGNPKRGGSARRFALYYNGITVAEVTKAHGNIGLLDIAWDFNHGFIRVDKAEPAPAPAEASAEPAPAPAGAPTEAVA